MERNQFLEKERKKMRKNENLPIDKKSNLDYFCFENIEA